MEALPFRSYEKDYDVQLDITIEMNLNQVVIARDGYTLLDFISDIGGMQGMLISGAAMLLAIWNYHYAENLLVSKLYRLSSRSLTEEGIKVGKQALVLKKFPLINICDFICEKLPHSLQCCFRNSE